MSIVNIDSMWLAQVKKVLAFPAVDELLLTDDDIKDLCIFPILQKYFTKFPIKEEQQLSINGELAIPFPDTYTFGVLDARVVDLGLLPGSGTSFWDLVMFQTTTSVGSSMRGTGAYGVKGYNPSGLLYQRDIERQKYKSQQNNYATVKSRVDFENRQLIVYSSITGALNITWAKYSNNFNDVRFERRDDVIKLCQAELLDHLADTASILSDSGLEITINIDQLKSRATELKDKVEERWSQINDIIWLHSV
jgi:hypothetical protein